MLSPKLTQLFINDNNTKILDLNNSLIELGDNLIEYTEEEFKNFDSNELTNFCSKIYTTENINNRIHILNNLYKINKELCDEHFNKLLVQYLYNPLIESNQQTLINIVKDSILSYEQKYKCAKLLYNEYKERSNSENDDNIGYELMLIILTENENNNYIHTLIKIEMMQILMETYKYKLEVERLIIQFITNKNYDHYDDYHIYNYILKMSEHPNTKSEYIILMFKTICISGLLSTRYRILASQFFLGNEIFSFEDKLQVENMIIYICEDVNYCFYLRADAADLLITQGITDRGRQVGMDTIILLGRNNNIENNLDVFYDNKQNIHIRSIEDSVKVAISKIINADKDDNGEVKKSYIHYNNLCSEILKEYCILNNIEQTNKNTNIHEINDGHVLGTIEHIQNKEIQSTTEDDYTINKENNENDNLLFELNSIKSSLVRFSLDRSNRSIYSNVKNIQMLFIKIWNIIKTHKYKDTLIKRLFEELIDMNGTCTTGHVSRIVNVLSGFEVNGEIIQIKMDIKSEMTAVMMTKINKKIQDITSSETPENEKYQNDILEEMMWNNNYERRVNFNKFFRENIINIRDELYKEYVSDQTLIDTETFEIYFRSILEKFNC